MHAAAASTTPTTLRLLGTSRRDAAPILAALVLGALVATVAAFAARRGPIGLVALGLTVAVVVWWGSNTVAHIHLHAPLLRARALNRAFSLYLSLLLCVPQTLWRDRHLWHHAGEPAPGPRVRDRRAFAVETALVLALAIGLGALQPLLLLGWIPGWLVGLGLCQAQGDGEHKGPLDGDVPDGISCYGRLYNLLWFNDGYHAEHHRHPREHWTRLPARRVDGAATSAWPPVLRPPARALNAAAARALVWLEHLALGSPRLQRFLIAAHARALGTILAAMPSPPGRVCVVGGGLFPRTALVLRRLAPRAALTILDADAAHLDRARAELAARGLLDGITLVHARFDPAAPGDFDLVIVPLGYRGDRAALYRAAITEAGSDGDGSTARPALAIHDWLWRRRGRVGATVSLVLLKRINLA